MRQPALKDSRTTLLAGEYRRGFVLGRPKSGIGSSIQQQLEAVDRIGSNRRMQHSAPESSHAGNLRNLQSFFVAHPLEC